MARKEFGNTFQTNGPATLKGLSPILTRLDLGMANRLVSRERRDLVGWYRVTRSER